MEVKMCKLKEYDKDKFVADIKYDYILNIAKQASVCKNISKIMLFGSAIEERCNENSDIDIAIFGDMQKIKYLRSKEYDRFHTGVVSYRGDFTQDYDILYFCNGKFYDDDIMDDILKGVEIYRRADL
jgi:predicted nucleotidyltransferase